MAASTSAVPLTLHDPLEEALQDAREALARLRATLGTPWLSEAHPSRQPTASGTSGAQPFRARR